MEAGVRFVLLAALLRRTTRYEEIETEALAVAQMTSGYVVDREGGLF
jgi:hypothetical protein